VSLCASLSLCATVNRSVPAQCLSTQAHSCSVSSTHTLPAPLNTPPHTDPLLFMHALRIHTIICVRGCVERGTNAATRNYMNAATRNYTLLCVHTLCIHNTHTPCRPQHTLPHGFLALYTHHNKSHETRVCDADTRQCAPIAHGKLNGSVTHTRLNVSVPDTHSVECAPIVHGKNNSVPP